MERMSEYAAHDADGRRKYLNQAENRRFVKATGELPLAEASLCLMLYYTGCRISEALNLSADSIEWESNLVLIRSLKKRGKKVIRRVPIPVDLTRLLRKLVKESSAEESLWPISRSTAWRIIKYAMKEANITGAHASPKGLRHGFGARGAMEYIPVNMLQQWLGHSHPNTTAIYLNIMGDEERVLIKRTWKT